MSKYPKLDEYIKKEKLKGKTVDQLRVEMKGAGYSEEDLQNIFPKPIKQFATVDTTSDKKVVISKKNKIKYIPLIAAAFLLMAVVFYFWSTGALASAPYNQNNLFSGLAGKISEIKTSSYAFSGSFVGMKRDDDAKPFVPVGNTIELKEKYYRDYQRIDFYNSLRRNYRNTPPDSLSSVKDLSVTDPLTNKFYEYKLTDDGHDFEISITFETAEAISIARESNDVTSKYYLQSNTIKPVKIDNQTVTFTKSSRSLGLSSKPPQNFYESMNEYIDYIPEGINVNASFSAKSNLEDDKKDVEINISADGDLEDITYKIDVDFISKDENYYIKINNFPSFLLSFIGIPKGEWFLVSEEPVFGLDYILNNTSVIFEDSDYEDEVKKYISFILDTADKNKLLEIIGSPKKEKVNDQVAYKYVLKINKNGLEPFIEDLISELKIGEYEFIEDYNISELENILDYVKGEEFDSVIDYYNENTQNILWVNKRGYPVKFESSNRLIPNSDILENRQFVLSLSITLDNINKIINIESPKDYKKIEDIQSTYGSSISQAHDKGSDAAIKSYLSNIRATAELIYDSNNGSYGIDVFNIGPCEGKEGTLFAEKGIYGYIQSAAIDGQMQNATCVSGSSRSDIQSWAVSVPLVTDPDYSYCVDSRGNALEIVGEIKGNTCNGTISKKKDNSTKTETVVIKEVVVADPVVEKTVDFSDDFISYFERAANECYDEYNYDYGPSPEIVKNRKECLEGIVENIFEEQEKIKLAKYDLCGTSFEIEVKTFDDSSNYVGDIARLYSSLANKEESELFCNEFKTSFSGYKVGILLDNFHFDSGGFDYNKINFYKLFDEMAISNFWSGSLSASLDFIKKEVRYLPSHNPGDHRKENPGGGYTTSNVVLGNF